MKNVKYIVFVLQFLFIIVNLLTIHAEKQHAHDKISSSLRKSPIASSVYDEDSQTYITPLSDENIPTTKLLRKNEKIMTNTRKKEVVHVSEGEYTIINNEYFGLKEDTERKVKVIFVLYNEGDMSMLPGKHSQMKFAKSASKLVDVLEQANLIVSV